MKENLCSLLFPLYEPSQCECFAFILHAAITCVSTCVRSRSEGGGTEEEAAVGHRAMQISAKLA